MRARLSRALRIVPRPGDGVTARWPAGQAVRLCIAMFRGERPDLPPGAALAGVSPSWMFCTSAHGPLVRPLAGAESAGEKGLFGTVRNAADRVFLECYGAGASVRPARPHEGLPSLAVKLVAGHGAGAGGGAAAGTIRMPPGTLARIPARLPGPDAGSRTAGTPTACPQTPGNSGWRADISPGIIRRAGSVRRPGPGTSRRSRLLWSVAVGAGRCGCPERRRPISRHHVE